MRKSVRMHFHYQLFAEILRDLARTAGSAPVADVTHRDALFDGAKALASALEAAAGKEKEKGDIAQLTPEEEVRLLHITNNNRPGNEQCGNCLRAGRKRSCLCQ